MTNQKHNQEWFISRVGKKVFRTEASCQCDVCKEVGKFGLIIVDEFHAKYLYDCQNELNLYYFEEEDMETQSPVEWLIEQIKSNIFCDHIQGVEYWDKDTLFEFLEQAKQKEQVYKYKIRKAVANYMSSEGCSCCEGKDHKDHAETLAKLLDVPMYDDGSGYNFHQFKTHD